MRAFSLAFQEALTLHFIKQSSIKTMISTLYLELVQEVLSTVSSSQTDMV